MSNGRALPSKVCLLGSAAVGKSSISSRFIDGKFSEDYEPTIGGDFKTRILEIDKQRVNLCVWDLGGQRRFQSLGPGFILGSDVSIIVYDITNKESFDDVQYWLEELRAQDDDIRGVAFVGNKCDLEADRRVSKEEVQSMANDKGYMFFEVSSKTGHNVDELFIEIAKKTLTDFHSVTVRRAADSLDYARSYQRSAGCCQIL